MGHDRECDFCKELYYFDCDCQEYTQDKKDKLEKYIKEQNRILDKLRKYGVLIHNDISLRDRFMSSTVSIEEVEKLIDRLIA